MTSEALRKAVNEVWSRLRNSPAGVNLSNGCREALLGKQLEHPERAVEIITTIGIEVGSGSGWFSLWRAGGGLKAILWIPSEFYGRPEVRKNAQDIQRVMGGVMHLSETQLRVIGKKGMMSWLAGKGWPIQNGPCVQ